MEGGVESIAPCVTQALVFSLFRTEDQFGILTNGPRVLAIENTHSQVRLLFLAPHDTEMVFLVPVETVVFWVGLAQRIQNFVCKIDGCSPLHFSLNYRVVYPFYSESI